MAQQFGEAQYLDCTEEAKSFVPDGNIKHRSLDVIEEEHLVIATMGGGADD